MTSSRSFVSPEDKHDTPLSKREIETLREIADPLIGGGFTIIDPAGDKWPSVLIHRLILTIDARTPKPKRAKPRGCR